GRKAQRVKPHQRKPLVELLEDRLVLDSALGASAAATNYVTGLYFDLLHRAPRAGEVAPWAAAVDAGVSRAEVAQDFVNSPEYRSQFLVDDYQTFLGRQPSQAELNTWLAAMDAGTTPEQVTAAFLASDERAAQVGSDPAAWLQATYQQMFGR